MSTPGVNTVTRIGQAHLALESRFAKFKADALRNYRYVIGDQIDADVKSALESQRRPALIYNLIAPLIVYVAGGLSSDRSKMRATPTRYGDQLLAELHTVLVSDYAMEGCDGYEEIVKASIDAVIAKVGWTSNYWSTRRNPEGQWITESFDPLMLMWDPDGRKEDQTDWRYMDASGFYSAEEIISIYNREGEMDQDVVDKIIQAADRLEGPFRKGEKSIGWLDRVVNGVSEWWRGDRADQERGLINSFTDGKRGIYRVIEWHERRTISKKWVYSPVSRDKEMIPQESELDEAYIVSVMQKYPDAQVRTVTSEELWIIVCAPGLLPDTVILEKPYAVQGAGFQYKPIWCYTFHPDLVQTVSMVDNLIGPSDSFNQRRMTMLEYLMDTVNPRIDAPKDSIDPADLDDWQSGERGVLRFFRPQGSLKPEADRPIVDAGFLKSFADEERDLVQKISGITPNLQGRAESSQEPASLYRQRVQQGMVMLNFFNSHVQRAMSQIFLYCDRNLQEFMTVPRIVRLLSEPPRNLPGIVQMPGPETEQYWLQVNYPTLEGIVNDVGQGEFDFRPDLTQLGETARQMNRVEMLELLRIVPPQLVNWSLVFMMMDNPDAEEFAKFASKMLGLALESQEQQQRLQTAHGELSLVSQGAQAAQANDPLMQASQRAQE